MTNISDLDAKAKEDRLKALTASLTDSINLCQFPSALEAIKFNGETLEDLYNAEMIVPEKLIDPWLPANGIVLLHAKAGTGKTFFAMTAAYALAVGKNFLHWKISKPRRVLYIDAEMQGHECRDNFLKIGTMFDNAKPNDNLIVINYYRQAENLELNLSDERQQNALLEYIKEKSIEVVVLDNISMLCPDFRENEAPSWSPMQTFESRVKKAGASIIRIMHTGKSGLVRATSKVFDAVNTTIYLESSKDLNSEEQRAEFKVKFEKARGFHGKDSRPVLLALKSDNDIYRWECDSLEVSTYEKVIECVKDGLSVKDISDELYITKSCTSKNIKKALLNGRIAKNDIKRHSNYF